MPRSIRCLGLIAGWIRRVGSVRRCLDRTVASVDALTVALEMDPIAASLRCRRGDLSADRSLALVDALTIAGASVDALTVAADQFDALN